MAGPLRVVDDVAPAEWLQQALAGDGTVASQVPAGFPAIARIRHPGTVSTALDAEPWGAERPVTWAEAGELLGRSFDAVGSWHWGVGHEQHELADGRRVDPPHEGDVPIDILARVARVLVEQCGDADVRCAVWEGHGFDVDAPGLTAWVWLEGDDAALTEAERAAIVRRESERRRAEHVASIDPAVVEAIEGRRLLGLPRDGMARGHVLLEARLSTFADPSWVVGAGLGWTDLPGRTLNALWPAWLGPDALDRPDAWMLACDMDADTTLVGGSAELIGALLAHPDLEAVRVEASTPLV